jgi:hemerythrin superfamily protein
MDALDLLTEQHRMLEGQMKTLLEIAEPTTKAAMLALLGDHLTVHITSEEEVFYPAVKARRTEDILLESLEEHLSLKRLLADLLALSPADTTFEPKFKVLREQTVHHHEEEEEHLFPKVRKLLDDEAREELGHQMTELQESLRIRGAPRDAIADQTDKATPLT